MVLSTVLAQSLPCDPVMVLGDADEIPPNKLNEVKKLMIKVKKNKGLDAILLVMNKYFSFQCTMDTCILLLSHFKKSVRFEGP